MSENEFDKQAFAAELIGTFGWVFIGGLALMQADLSDGTGFGTLEVAFAHMLVLSFMVYFSRRFSGGHLNPAVTLSFYATGKFNEYKTGYYIGAQLAGSILAGLFLKLFATDILLDAAENKSELGFPHLNSEIKFFEGAMIEVILTFFLVFVVWAMTVDDRAPSQIYGLAIGGTVGFGILVGGNLTGAAMNPARIFGPALIAFDWDDHLLYWIGPIIGGIIAGILYKTLFLDSDDGSKPAKKPAKKVASKKKATKKATPSDD